MKQFILTSVVILTIGTAFIFSIAPFSISVPRVKVGGFSFPIVEKFALPLPTKILFTGDVMLARDVEKKNDIFSSRYPFIEVSDLFSEHDHVVVNFEGSIPKTHVPTPGMTFQFSVKESDVSSLPELGVSYASLANNHARDYGTTGLQNTKKILSEHAIVPFGQSFSVATSSVSIIDSEYGTMALIGIDLVLSTPTDKELIEVFEYAKSISDLQTVFVHWGAEYKLEHSAFQEKFATRFVDLGADLIVGHHPHVVQDIQKIDDVLIFYSLGNLVFDQYFSKDVQEGLTLSLSLGTTTEIVLIPVSTIGSKTQPREMALYERKLFLESLSKRSDQSLKESILDGIIPF